MQSQSTNIPTPLNREETCGSYQRKHKVGFELAAGFNGQSMWILSKKTQANSRVSDPNKDWGRPCCRCSLQSEETWKPSLRCHFQEDLLNNSYSSLLL